MDWVERTLIVILCLLMVGGAVVILYGAHQRTRTKNACERLCRPAISEVLEDGCYCMDDEKRWVKTETEE